MGTEDFTTYTEVDPNSHISVTSTTIDADVYENEEAYVYADKGADHFGAAFEHDIEVTPDDWSSYWSEMGFGILTNVVDGWKDLRNLSKQAVGIQLYGNPSAITFYIRDCEDGSNDSGGAVAEGTTRYLTIERTSETDIEARIYSDSGRTTLVDTISTTITSGRRYRYIMPASSYHVGQAQEAFATVANLDLNEAAAAGFARPKVNGTLADGRGALVA